MSWQVAIVFQVFFSAFMSLYTRKLTFRHKSTYMLVGVCTYFAVALTGAVLSILANGGLPLLPTGDVWLLLVAEGISIPVSWVATYKLISYVGAANGVLISALNYIATCVVAVLILGDAFSGFLLSGAVLIVSSVVLASYIKPDVKHLNTVPRSLKLSLGVVGSLFFTIGMVCEKLAIDKIGVWDYTFYGWTMQMLGMVCVLLLLGRKQIAQVSCRVVKDGLVLGFMTALAGTLYVYALSKGSLSHTIIAVSGKIALTMFLAAIFLGERNNLYLRVVAFVMCVTGIVLIIQ